MRRLRGARHQIDYFHQVDDPYSDLALQAIGPLAERYDVDFRFHLVSQTDRVHAPEPALLYDYARSDCAWVAPHYGLTFARDARRPTQTQVRRVERVLAGCIARNDVDAFQSAGLDLSRALWTDDADAVERAAHLHATLSDSETDRILESGNALRKKRRHYSGAMFWYAGEWYWGVDRLHHLERRLIALGARRQSPSIQSAESKPIFDRPPLDWGSIRNDGSLSLEIFPSLRSPYTAFIFEPSMQLARDANVPVSLRPVMPMVMRGVPAPAAKGLYIILDAIREAEHMGLPFGNMFDPIGRPVERGFALWPFAHAQGRGEAFLTEFLRAAFVLGENTGTEAGLRTVVTRSGLDFEAARSALEKEEWREELEANRQTMYDELGLWGVPSYRLRGPDGEPDLCVWGQDRLWLVAAEIRRRLAGERLPD